MRQAFFTLKSAHWHIEWRKEHANSDSLSEYDWNSGKNKTLLDSAIKSSLLESVIESIIECEETLEYNSYI